MSISLDQAKESKAWPFIEALKILDKINNKTPKKGYVLFATGYGPSGLPHIGTFAEVARTIMVKKAFEQISDIPTKLICFSDDLDGLRKVPSNIPNQEMIQQHIDMPLTSVPDPFEQEKSFGDYMNKKLKSFLDAFNFEYEFRSATKEYQSGHFNEKLHLMIDKYDDVMNLMLPTFREERRATYSPFMPICKDTGKVLQVPIEKVDKSNKTIFYRNEKEELVETEVINGKCKLQWKPDFGMRWAALEVDYEMYGKDHMPNAQIYGNICKILEGTPPAQFFYEMFLDESGTKISKSKGNSISIDDWLKYAPIESLAYYIYQSPTKAKKLYFEVIPKCCDEYITFNNKYFETEDILKKLSNPVYHVHSGKPAKIETFGISFSLLLNLASVCNPDNKEVLWRFISKYCKEATPENAPFLDKLVDNAVNYYNDFVKSKKNYIEPNESHKEILRKILNLLQNIDLNISAEDLQTELYTIGRESGYENLRDYFKDLYQILLGQEQGPRLGTFFKLYGIEDTIKLVNDKLNNG